MEYLPSKLYITNVRPWKLQCFHQIKQHYQTERTSGHIRRPRLLMQPLASAAKP